MGPIPALLPVIKPIQRYSQVFGSEQRAVIEVLVVFRYTIDVVKSVAVPGSVFFSLQIASVEERSLVEEFDP